MPRPIEFDDLYAIPFPSDPQLSPDGTVVAFVLTRADRDADEDRSTIRRVPTAGGEARELTTGGHDAAPRWSPDGQSLAFVSKRGDAAPQILVLPADGGEARTLTDLPLGAGEPVWSPDGSRIAFAAPVALDASGDAKKDAARPVATSTLDYQADGAGVLRDVRTHLFVVDASGGPARRLTSGDFFVSNPVWSPDGSRIAFSTSRTADRDLAPAASVHIIPAAGGVLRRVTPEESFLDVVDWSPDGSTLLLAGQERLRVGHVRLFTASVEGGEPPAPLTPEFDRNVMVGGPAYPGARPRYVDGSAAVLFCARERGRVHVLSVPAAGGAPERLVDGDRVVAGLSEVRGTIAFVAGLPESPGEVFVRDGDGERTLTRLFADALPDVEVFAPQQRTFTAPDGVEIEGWIVRAPGTDGATPLLLDIHGGPHNAWGPAFDPIHLWHQTLAAQGWTILFVNPRGSDGYGERFWSGLLGDGWGRADERDFAAALDGVVEEGLADPERLAVTGYSYGGYMTCWLTARTDRFAAAVAGGSVTDLLGEVGTADMGWFLGTIELGTSPYEKQEALAELSPLTYVTSVHTPTLVLHGEEDRRCPISQGATWFTALRARGVPAEFVRYPGGSHLFILSGPPSHRLDYARRVEDWVRRYAERKENGPVARLEDRVKGLQARLAGLIERHGVPGAAAGVLHRGELATAAAGVLNVETGVEATADSVFQYGSIGKVWTATVVMQLVEEGLLDLDAPIADVLPELRVADPDVSRQVTMRNLLAHTSGIDGDHFPDPGRGDDNLERYVETCAELQQTHPLGATMSYCNAGYVIAGRVIEKLTGQVWDAAMRERLFDKLGLTHTVTLPEEALRFRAAFGHLSEPDQPLQLAPAWHLPRSTGPAGGISGTVGDLLAFARMHLGDGKAADGTQVLSAESARAMREPQIEVPDPYTLGSHWGLGWILFDWNGRSLYGHDGNTIGQSAYMRILPDHDLAIALLTNGGSAHDVYEELFGELLFELAGVRMPSPPEPLPGEQRIDWPRFVGTYERASVRMDVEQRDGELVVTTTLKGPIAAMLPKTTEEYVLRPAGPDVFVTKPESQQVQGWTPCVFFDLPDGTRALHFGARATPRTEGV